jgi:predicted nucleotidyltransferase
MLVYPHEILHNQTPQQRGDEGAGYVVWIRKAIPPRSGFVQHIFLFGSRVTGEARPESDYDFAFDAPDAS